MGTALAILKDLLGPQKSIHVTDIRDYNFSYREKPFGPLLTLTVNATSQFEANMLANRKMDTLVVGGHALKASLREA